MQYRQNQKKNPLIALVVLVILVVVIGGFRYWNSLFEPVNLADKSEKAFVVKKGESTEQIVMNLKMQNLIKSPLAFKYALKNSDKDLSIQPGDFKLSPSMDVSEIIKSLSEGTLDKWVTLLEGWRVEEEADKLNKELGIKKEEFLKYAKEGYMFPDTYLFNPKASAQTITSTLKNTFETKYDGDLRAKIIKKGLTIEEGVILASLVEREARSDEVRTKVAGIILHRLKIGMKLDIDSTVRYAKDSQALKAVKKVDKFWLGINRDDYTGVISPYNTYLNNGLPPGPICNPSLSSLNAVANADPSTPYLYYYHDSQGNSYYARTLEEHNLNVANHP